MRRWQGSGLSRDGTFSAGPYEIPLAAILYNSHDSQESEVQTSSAAGAATIDTVGGSSEVPLGGASMLRYARSAPVRALPLRRTSALRTMPNGRTSMGTHGINGRAGAAAMNSAGTSAWQGYSSCDVMHMGSGPDSCRLPAVADVDGVGGAVHMQNLHPGIDARRFQHQSTMSSDAPAGHTGPVRNQRRQPRTGTWSNATLKAAISAVERGGRLKTVARYFDIPPTSLSDHLHGRTLGRKRGPPTVLQPEEEIALTEYMAKMQQYGHPLSMQQLRLKVATITQERVTPFRGGLPGDSWVRWFKKRHPYLTLRSSQGLEFARAKGLCPENVASFYSNLEHMYRHITIHQRIYGIVTKVEHRQEGMEVV
jgi:hypothetical protein